MRVANEVYFRRLRDKLRGLATWARVMREHRERLRRQQKARQRWGKAIEKVRNRVREERARGERGDAAASTSQDESERAGEAGPSEGRVREEVRSAAVEWQMAHTGWRGSGHGKRGSGW